MIWHHISIQTAYTNAAITLKAKVSTAVVLALNFDPKQLPNKKKVPKKKSDSLSIPTIPSDGRMSPKNYKPHISTHILCRFKHKHAHIRPSHTRYVCVCAGLGYVHPPPHQINQTHWEKQNIKHIPNDTHKKEKENKTHKKPADEMSFKTLGSSAQLHSQHTFAQTHTQRETGNMVVLLPEFILYSAKTFYVFHRYYIRIKMLARPAFP